MEQHQAYIALRVTKLIHVLTDWGRATHICVNDQTIIGSDNGLSPGRHQAITWTNDGILLIGPLGTNFSEILIEIQTFSFKKMRLKVSSAKWRPCYLGLNVLNICTTTHRVKIKMSYCQHLTSHCTGRIIRPSSPHNRISHTNKAVFHIAKGTGICALWAIQPGIHTNRSIFKLKFCIKIWWNPMSVIQRRT